MPPSKEPTSIPFKPDRLHLGTLIAAGILCRMNKSPTTLADEVEAYLKELEKRLS